MLRGRGLYGGVGVSGSEARRGAGVKGMAELECQKRKELYLSRLRVKGKRFRGYQGVRGERG